MFKSLALQIENNFIEESEMDFEIQPDYSDKDETTDEETSDSESFEEHSNNEIDNEIEINRYH